jgi:hypothetical protein
MLWRLSLCVCAAGTTPSTPSCTCTHTHTHAHTHTCTHAHPKRHIRASPAPPPPSPVTCVALEERALVPVLLQVAPLGLVRARRRVLRGGNNARVCARARVCMCVCVCAYVYMCVYTCVCVCVVGGGWFVAGHLAVHVLWAHNATASPTPPHTRMSRTAHPPTHTHPHSPTHTPTPTHRHPHTPTRPPPPPRSTHRGLVGAQPRQPLLLAHALEHLALRRRRLCRRPLARVARDAARLAPRPQVERSRLRLVCARAGCCQRVRVRVRLCVVCRATCVSRLPGVCARRVLSPPPSLRGATHPTPPVHARRHAPPPPPHTHPPEVSTSSTPSAPAGRDTDDAAAARAAASSAAMVATSSARVSACRAARRAAAASSAAASAASAAARAAAVCDGGARVLPGLCVRACVRVGGWLVKRGQTHSPANALLCVCVSLCAAPSPPQPPGYTHKHTHARTRARTPRARRAHVALALAHKHGLDELATAGRAAAPLLTVAVVGGVLGRLVLVWRGATQRASARRQGRARG